jgi:hypothetical protein
VLTEADLDGVEEAEFGDPSKSPKTSTTTQQRLVFVVVLVVLGLFLLLIVCIALRAR